MATNANPYPLPGFYFQIEYGGSTVAFAEATAHKESHDLIEYREGNDPGFHKIKMPGLKKFDNITLKRGVVEKRSDLYKWIMATSMNVPDRRTVKLKLLKNTGDPVYTITLNNCFVASYKFADMKAGNNDIAMEEVELAYESSNMIEQ